MIWIWMFVNLEYYLVFIVYAFAFLSMIVISESRKKHRVEKKSKKKIAWLDKELTDDSDTDVRESGILSCFQLLCIAFDCHFRETKK